jgi:hypothetical protein
VIFTGSIHRVLWRLQGGLCAICGQPIGSPRQASVDHVIAETLGGVSHLGNFVVTHGRCNRAKSNRLPTGCELIWLLAVNARLGVGPQTWRGASMTAKWEKKCIRNLCESLLEGAANIEDQGGFCEQRQYDQFVRDVRQAVEQIKLAWDLKK